MAPIPRSPIAQEQWELALEAAEENRYARARRHAKTVLKEDPSFTPAEELLESLQESGGGESPVEKLQGALVSMLSSVEGGHGKKTKEVITGEKQLFAALGYFPMIQLVSVILYRNSGFVVIHALSGTLISLSLFGLSFLMSLLSRVSFVFSLLWFLILILGFLLMGLGVYQAFTGRPSSIALITPAAYRIYQQYILPRS